MNPQLTLAIAIFLGIDTVVLIILLIAKLREHSRLSKIRHFGDKAEETVASYIEENIPSKVLFNHVWLATEHGATEIDHILVCRWGVFVIETKSHNGKIVIGKKEWIQYYGNKVIKFHSPLLQNEIHIKALESILKKHKKFARLKIRGLVVFTSKKVYFSEKKKGVIKLDKLNLAIKHGLVYNRNVALTARPNRFYLSKEKINEIADIIRQNIDVSEKNKRIHAKNVGAYNSLFNNNPLEAENEIYR